MESPFPLSSLGLLVPPLRLMSAVMWQVVRQRNIKHYEKLEEFVSMVTEAIPELLNNKQRRLLALGLRARMTVDLLQSQHPDYLKTVRSHLDRIRSFCIKQSDAAMEAPEANFVRLVESLLEDPDGREHFLKNVFPVEYGPGFDSALQTLVCEFLSRLEELLPVPDFKETASWISGAPTVLEEYMRCVSHGNDLKFLLQSKQCHGRLAKSAPMPSEDRLLSALSLPPSMRIANASHQSTCDSKSKAFPDFESPTTQASDVQLGTLRDSISAQLAERRASFNGNENRTDVNETRGGKDQHGVGSVEKPSVRLCSEEEGKVLDSPGDKQKKTDTAPQDAMLHEGPSASSEAPSTSTESPTSSTTNSIVCGPPRRRVAHKCPQCGRCFIYRYELLEHQRLHTGENPYKCSQCGKAFRRTSDLSTHRRTQCVNAAYICIKCGSSFGSIHEKFRHLCSQQTAQKFDCSQCGKSFKKAYLLGKHQLTHTQDRLFKCRQCGEAFPSMSELRTHQRMHPVENALQCKHCGKFYSSPASLAGHEQRHNQKRTQVCPRCGKAFKNKSDLKLHMRTHTGERPFQCTYCGKRFSVSGNLNIHIRTHTGEKPYLCSDCGKAFCSGGELQIHRRTHTGEKPYKCTVCGKGFTMASKVTLHMRVHTGERPYTCHECGKGFSRGNELKKHMLNHSGVRPYPCHVCTKTYTCLNHLKRHLKTHS